MFNSWKEFKLFGTIVNLLGWCFVESQNFVFNKYIKSNTSGTAK